MIATNDGDPIDAPYAQRQKFLCVNVQRCLRFNSAIKLWRYMIDRVAQQEAGPNGKS